mmetsp:Transcript_10052/g.10970  ORF Transcript_10052/g.10970 Transcript_10052/m.10970 type:complete len:173 (+) Transcript_10052:42-560(+)
MQGMKKLGRFVNKKSFVVDSLVKSSFGAPAASAKPEGRIKVTEKIVWLNIVSRDGTFQRLPAWEGESLTEALNRFSVTNFEAVCNIADRNVPMNEFPVDNYVTGPGCSECQVIISDPYKSLLPPMHWMENRWLFKAKTPITADSRLACCLKLTSEMNEMIVNIGMNTPGECS